MQLILSIFPGIGLLDMAFEEQGFCIVRGPDTLWGGNIKNFYPPSKKFDGIIGGPPCQCFSRLRYLVEANGFKISENLIPEFERVVKKASPKWFLMENVKSAPIPQIKGYSTNTIQLNNRHFGAEQNRVRAFTFGIKGNQTINLLKFIEQETFETIDWSPTICASGGIKPSISKNNKTRAKYLGYKTKEALKESIRLQGLPDNFLDKAPFTLAGKHKVIGNGVPLAMGRAIAKAIKELLEINK
jgi:DNA (cytosine-5)-methyltransferase 1